MKNTSNIGYSIQLPSLFGFVLSTANRLYVGWFGLLMFPLLSVAIIAYITAFILAPAVDIDANIDLTYAASFSIEYLTHSILPIKPYYTRHTYSLTHPRLIIILWTTFMNLFLLTSVNQNEA